jgi:SulP family sulfate permease
MFKMYEGLKNDIPASIIVFFVALPLCLGIALASGAPLFSGILSGIIGGIVVGIFSGSSLGVSGPSAGYAVIVLSAISSLGSWPAFLMSLVLAGIIQVIAGYAKIGFIAYFFPSSVIKGMLTGIGLLIILKQIPHALGYDKDVVGDLSYFQTDGENTLTGITSAINAITPGAMLIAFLSIALLIIWDTLLTNKYRLFQLIQGPIVVVMLGIVMNTLFQLGVLDFSLNADQLVSLPIVKNVTAFLEQFTLPDFSAVTRLEVWKTAVVLALVVSLEALLCVEATDKLDRLKRVTPKNRELKAQGLGNIVSGLCGGLPVTQVIIRSSANITFGAKTKLSTILHGVFLLISAATMAEILNKIPLASLAAILIMVGYKLARPSIFKQMYTLGQEQFIPFSATVLGILTTDLLRGIAIGMGFGIFYTLRHSYRNSYYFEKVITKENEHPIHHIVLAEEVSFFDKASIVQALDVIPKNSTVIIDCAKSKSIAYDVVECIQDYRVNAKLKNITVTMIGFIEP